MDPKDRQEFLNRCLVLKIWAKSAPLFDYLPWGTECECRSENGRAGQNQDDSGIETAWQKMKPAYGALEAPWSAGGAGDGGFVVMEVSAPPASAVRRQRWRRLFVVLVVGLFTLKFGILLSKRIAWGSVSARVEERRLDSWECVNGRGEGRDERASAHVPHRLVSSSAGHGLRRRTRWSAERFARSWLRSALRHLSTPARRAPA